MTLAAREFVSAIVVDAIKSGELKCDLMRGLICLPEEVSRQGSEERLYEHIIAVVMRDLITDEDTADEDSTDDITTVEYRTVESMNA